MEDDEEEVEKLDVARTRAAQRGDSVVVWR